MQTLAATRSVCQLGFWSAVTATLSAIGYGIAVIVMMISSVTAAAATPAGWHGVRPLSLLSVHPDAAPDSITGSRPDVHRPDGEYPLLCAQDKRVWSQLGIAFAIVYAVMASLNYITQLTVVRFSILNKETMGWRCSSWEISLIFWALTSAYVFMNLRCCRRPVFEGGELERRIRWLFYANGASVVVTIFGVIADSPPIYLLGSLVPWCVVFSLPPPRWPCSLGARSLQMLRFDVAKVAHDATGAA